MDATRILQTLQTTPPKNDRVITSRIPAELLAQYHDICKQEDVYSGQLLQCLIEEFVASYKNIRVHVKNGKPKK